MTQYEVAKELLSMGVFSIDANGNLWRCKQTVGNKWSGRRWRDIEPRLCNYQNQKGYYILSIYFKGKVYAIGTHIFAAVSYFGLPDTGLQVNHISGVVTDNRKVNLEYVTLQQNQLHACRVLGKRQGEKHGMSKLTNDQARAIRAEYSDGGITYKELSGKYGVCESEICHIMKGNRYGRIPE